MVLCSREVRRDRFLKIWTLLGPVFAVMVYCYPEDLGLYLDFCFVLRVLCVLEDCRAETPEDLEFSWTFLCFPEDFRSLWWSIAHFGEECVVVVFLLWSGRLWCNCSFLRDGLQKLVQTLVFIQIVLCPPPPGTAL